MLRFRMFPVVHRHAWDDNRALFASPKTDRLAAAVVIRLYSGWSYVSIRLDAEVVEYEESGAVCAFMGCTIPTVWPVILQ